MNFPIFWHVNNVQNNFIGIIFLTWHLGCVAQSVTCLATDACLTADPGVASSIPVRPILSWRLIMK